MYIYIGVSQWGGLHNYDIKMMYILYPSIRPIQNPSYIFSNSHVNMLGDFSNI